MTSGTRNVLIGGATVLALGLVGGVVSYLVGIPAVGALAGEPAELIYVPEDATVVAFADVRRVMDSPLRQEIRQLLPEHAGVAEAEGRRHFQEMTGIDVEQDVEYVVAYLLPRAAAPEAGGVTPVEPGGGRVDEGLVLVRGRFDQTRIEQLFEDHGGVVEAYRGKRLIVRPLDVPSPSPGEPGEPGEPVEPGEPGEPVGPLGNDRREFAVGFIQAGLIAVGTRAGISRAIDLESGSGANVTRNDSLMALVRDSKDGDVWAIGRFDRLIDRARMPGDLANRLPPIAYFAASGRFDTGLSGRIRADTRDDESAQQLGDVIRGFVALARMQSSSQPQFETLLQSLQLSTSGTSVMLQFALPAGTLRSLLPVPPSSDTPPQP